MSIQHVVYAQVQFLGVAGLELETAAQIQPDVGGHLVVVHRREVVQGVLLSEEGNRRVFARGNGLPMAGLECE